MSYMKSTRNYKCGNIEIVRKEDGTYVAIIPFGKEPIVMNGLTPLAVLHEVNSMGL